MIPPEQKLEMVVYIARKMGWSREQIGNLSPIQFVTLYNELIFQESRDRWEAQQNLAMLLAAIYNTIPKSRGGKIFSSKDFYNVPQPMGAGEGKEVMTEIDNKAIEAGIILPEK